VNDDALSSGKNIPPNRRVMKRCFMNGKSCRFSSQFSSKFPKDSPNAFVIMPFDPNFKAFYDWKLKKYLADKFDLTEGNIQTADEITNIGYIICEKVCNKIQESDQIFADVSLNNPNVFYELGLASGLQLPIILIKNTDNRIERKCVSTILSYFGSNNIFNYSVLSINELNDKSNSNIPRDGYPLPLIKRQARNLKISVLSFSNNDSSPRSRENDLIDFGTLIQVAAEKAINDIITDLQESSKMEEPSSADLQSSEESYDGSDGLTKSFLKSSNEISDNPTKTVFSEPWKYAMQNYNASDFLNVDRQNMDCKIESNFESVAKKIAESFCVIIDVSDSNPLAYFWLGYTHAMGFNAIPVNRIRLINGKPDNALAFDLNALWYAEYDENNPTRLRDDLRRTIISLLERDLPDWQRQAFWDRFPQESKLKVFMGAIHHSSPEREVVGDWDVRAVSELFSYLPSIRNAAAIKLVTPIYSPEVAEVEFKELYTKKEFNERFREGLDEELRGSNAIVIASPDVNPVTEYLLWKIYGIKEYNKNNELKPFLELNSAKRKGFVAVKRGKETTINKDGDNRLFYLYEPYVKHDFDWDKVPGDNNEKFIVLLKDNFGIDWVDIIKKSEDCSTIEVLSEDKKRSLSLKHYVFNWDKVPGEDNQKLISLLKHNFGFDWVENGKIIKSNDGRNIELSSDEISSGGKSLSLKIQDKENKIIIDINNDASIKSPKEIGSIDELKNVYPKEVIMEIIDIRPNVRPNELMAKRENGVTTVLNNPEKEYRGFREYYKDNKTDKTYDRLFVEEYKSQSDIKKSDKGFDLLGHLVVAYYQTNGKQNLVVLLNGISGPATFVLSQIITGFGGTPDAKKRLISENMLEQLNRRLDEISEKDINIGLKKGVEAIIRVSINKESKPNFAFVDTRTVDVSKLGYRVGPSIID